jgi:hypothetical protein
MECITSAEVEVSVEGSSLRSLELVGSQAAGMPRLVGEFQPHGASQNPKIM